MLVTGSLALLLLNPESSRPDKQRVASDLTPAVQAGVTDGVFRMRLYHNPSGWTLLFALLTLAVICHGFAIWMGWFSTQ